jgi:V8-like Glu-specific endopeptidase
MSSILDAFPYPWAQPGAQQLHVALTDLFPDPLDAVNIAGRAGLDRAKLNARQAPIYIWMEILDLAGRTGLTHSLAQQAHDLLNANNPRRPFLAGLLANVPVSVDAEPRDAKGAPKFLGGSDDVSEPEALLYYDDLTIQIGRVPGLIGTLQRLIQLAPAVCRMVVDINGTSKHGTGFRVGPDLLLTNWHVCYNTNTGAKATVVTAEFGYEDDGKGGALAATLVPCDVGSIVADRADDWAVLKAKQPLKDAWAVVKLSEAVAPVTGAAAYIIQHPGGDRKRVGFVRNQVASFDNRLVHYLTDTQEGSSGAPVFDSQGRLIALHHAGGRPQQVVGKPPVKKNEGIRIARIVAGLTGKGVTVP